MIGDELVELREFGNDFPGAAPMQPGAAVKADFFGGEPFGAAGEGESAAGTGQCAKTVSQQRPRAAFFSEAVVVVRFAVMDVAADAIALAVGIVEIPRDFFAGIILEQFGIGPLHSDFGE